MVKRKTPHEHSVSGYTRDDGTRVGNYRRGRGVGSQREHKVVGQTKIDPKKIVYVVGDKIKVDGIWYTIYQTDEHDIYAKVPGGGEDDTMWLDYGRVRAGYIDDVKLKRDRK